MMRTTVVLGVLLLLTAGCAQEEQIDLEAEKASLLAADEAWSQSVGDIDQLVSFLADDAVYLGNNEPRIEGKAAIREAWKDDLGAPGFSLEWSADRAEVAAGGDLGYTFGSSVMTMNDAEGNPFTTRGKYITIWRKQADGSWKAIVDMGNSDAPPPAPAPPATEVVK